jgi:hypothetical protein
VDDTDLESPLAILAALHTIKPDGAKPGDLVRINANRGEPAGTLLVASPKMDAAIVAVDAPGGLGDAVPLSTVVGYKPIRLVGRRGSLDTRIIEFTGLIGDVVPGERRMEPLTPVVLIFAGTLEPSDSGSLGYDIEPLEDGGRPRPYLLYQGEGNFSRGRSGYGLLLEQARRIWALELCDGPGGSERSDE